MEEPSDILTSNNFSSTNRALYGSTVATDAIRLVLADTNVYNVSDYVTSVTPLDAHVLDFYGSMVRSDSSSLFVATVNSADAMCFQSAGYVTGGIFETSEKGVVNFTDLLSYCDPGYSLTVYITSADSEDQLRATAEFWFRDCITGEYWGDRLCNPCEQGTFSVTDPATVSSLSELTFSKVCVECPDGSDSCYGSTVIVSNGYWRISELATSTIKCPYEHSCEGGSGTGDALCAIGYEGNYWAGNHFL